MEREKYSLSSCLYYSLNHLSSPIPSPTGFIIYLTFRLYRASSICLLSHLALTITFASYRHSALYSILCSKSKDFCLVIFFYSHIASLLPTSLLLTSNNCLLLTQSKLSVATAPVWGLFSAPLQPPRLLPPFPPSPLPLVAPSLSPSSPPAPLTPPPLQDGAHMSSLCAALSIKAKETF